MQPRNPQLVREHTDRINRVVRYIEAHLDSSLTVERLAGISGFSVYHFHRLFKQQMNENVHRFINRLRIEKAAKLLLFHPERSLSDIALECGLQSSAHFARTFRSFMGLTASDYRERYRLEAVFDRFMNSPSHADPRHDRRQLLESKYHHLEINVRHLPARQAVCSRYQGTINTGELNPAISALFNRMKAWMNARDLLTCDSRFIGIIPDDPYITPPERHRYFACITTERPIPPSLEFDTETIAGGKYAVFLAADRPDVIRDLIHLVSIHWLPLSPYQWDDSRRLLEIMHGNHPNDPEGIIRVEYCIPVMLRP